MKMSRIVRVPPARELGPLGVSTGAGRRRHRIIVEIAPAEKAPGGEQHQAVSEGEHEIVDHRPFLVPCLPPLHTGSAVDASLSLARAAIS